RAYGSRRNRHRLGEPEYKRRHIEASQGWKCLWKKPRLHLFGNLEFVCCTAFGFQLLRGGAPLLVYRLRHLIETDQREGIPVDIFEAGEHSAPNRSLFSKQQRRSVSSLVSRLLLILDAPKAWNVAKANSASSPLAIRGHDIFGDKSTCVGWPISLYSSESGSGAISVSTAVPSGGATPTQRC